MRRLLTTLVASAALLLTGAGVATAAPSQPTAVSQTVQSVQTGNSNPLCDWWGYCSGERNVWGNQTDCNIWGQNCNGRDNSVWGTPTDCNIWGNCTGQRDGWGNPIPEQSDQCTIWGCSSSGGTGSSDWFWGSSNDTGGSDSCSFYGTCRDNSGYKNGTGWDDGGGGFGWW
jgi:hypothetical protein